MLSLTKLFIFTLFFYKTQSFILLPSIYSLATILLLIIYLIFLDNKRSNYKLSGIERFIIYSHTLLPSLILYNQNISIEGSLKITCVFFLTLNLIYSILKLNSSFHIEPFQSKKIITSGPFQFIRHPIYSVNLILMLIFLISSDLTTYNIVLSIAYIILAIKRISIEETTLKKNKKYVEYTRKVKFKLIPYII